MKFPKLSKNKIFLVLTMILWSYTIGYERWISESINQTLITIFGNLWLLLLLSYLF